MYRCGSIACRLHVLVMLLRIAAVWHQALAFPPALLPRAIETVRMTCGVSFLASLANRVPENRQKTNGTPLLLPCHHPRLSVMAPSL